MAVSFLSSEVSHMPAHPIPAPSIGRFRALHLVPDCMTSACRTADNTTCSDGYHIYHSLLLQTATTSTSHIVLSNAVVLCPPQPPSTRQTSWTRWQCPLASSPTPTAATRRRAWRWPSTGAWSRWAARLVMHSLVSVSAAGAAPPLRRLPLLHHWPASSPALWCHL